MMISCEFQTVTKVSKRKHSLCEERQQHQQVLLRPPVTEAQPQEMVFVNVPHDGTLHQPSRATPARSSLKKSSVYESSPMGVDLLQSSFNVKNINHLLARLEVLETVERALEILEDSTPDLDNESDEQDYFDQQRAARLEQYSSRWKFSLRHDPPFL